MNTLQIAKNTFFALSLSFAAFSLSSCSESHAENMPEEIAELITVDSVAGETVNTEGISVLRTAFCTGIENHEPVGEAETFPNDVGRVYLYTKVKMEQKEETHIHHVWSYKGKTYSDVRLKVKGSTFRTYSYKTIPATMTGNWTVEVQTDEGQVLSTLDLSIQAPSAESGI